MDLHTGTLLQGGRYKIEKRLGQDSFGITYLAIQLDLNRQVCIKEFFMQEYCNRSSDGLHVMIGIEINRELIIRCRQKFMQEARAITQLNHTNIIRIYDTFEENDTAYYAMEYIDGCSLLEIVNRDGALPESLALRYIGEVASALQAIHGQQINHLNIKPSNILLHREGHVVLIDFGLTKSYDVGSSQTSTTPVEISMGYTPLEQYKVGGVSSFSPATDVYSLGATFYKLVTGLTPPDANEVMELG
ncbi:MAG: serine/threonine protein kinase, partial [Phocaeicola sp.]